MVGRVLKKLRSEFPSLNEINEVDVLRHPGMALRAGITMIPTLELEGRRLSGFLPREREIRAFLSEAGRD